MTESIATQFYSAFQRHDAESMASLYHQEATFQDPAFGPLNATEAGSMWKMLIQRAKGDLQVDFQIEEEDSKGAICRWEAHYFFGKQKRPVHNKIKATLRYRDGLIIEHRDEFNFWKWSRMALGVSGLLLGFTPVVKKKVRIQTGQLLRNFMRENNS